MNDEPLDSQIEIVQSKLNQMRMMAASDLSADPVMAALISPLTDLLTNLKTIQGTRRQEQNLAQLRQSLNSRSVAEQTATAVQQILKVDGAVIYQFNQTGEVLALAGTSDEALNLLEPDQLQGLMQQAGDLGNLRVDFQNDAALSQSLQSLIDHPSIAALIAMPVQLETQLLGMILVYQHHQPCPWQPAELELLRQLADEVAIALRQCKLHQQTQQLNVTLERQMQHHNAQLKNALEYESMLKRITERVRDSLDERTIIEAAVQELTLVLDIAGCNAALYDLDQGTSTIHYEYTQSIPTSQGRVAQMEDFPEIYQQLQRGWAFQFCSLLPNPVRGRVVLMACPIFVDPQSSRGVDQAVMGDLWLIHHPDRTFDEHELRLVQQVASQCAIAIRQARLYQAAQVQVQELAELNRLKDEFLSTVSHELRTPITNIKLAIELLRMATTKERRNQYLEILDQETVREANLINDLLDLQQLQAIPQPLKLERLVLQDWLLQLIEPFHPRFTARQQQFQMHCPESLPAIATETASLQRILTELLNNACKYTAPQQQIILTVSLHIAEVEPPIGNGTVVFEMRNQALIPAAELPKIFDKFYRCPNADPWKQGGTGLGLALVKKLVERLQGELQVTSANGWTQFTIKLPVPLDWTVSTASSATVSGTAG